MADDNKRLMSARVDAAEAEHWNAAAQNAGQTFSDLLRKVLRSHLASQATQIFTHGRPVYDFELGRSKFSLVRDAWRATRENDAAARDRLLRFSREQAAVSGAIQTSPAVQLAVTMGNTSAVIPPGYKPESYVPQLFQGRPLAPALSRGTLTDGTPFVVPRFAGATGAAGTHTEGENPTPGTLNLNQVTISPTAISGVFQLIREIMDASNRRSTRLPSRRCGSPTRSRSRPRSTPS